MHAEENYNEPFTTYCWAWEKDRSNKSVVSSYSCGESSIAHAEHVQSTLGAMYDYRGLHAPIHIKVSRVQWCHGLHSNTADIKAIATGSRFPIGQVSYSYDPSLKNG